MISFPAFRLHHFGKKARNEEEEKKISTQHIVQNTK